MKSEFWQRRKTSLEIFFCSFLLTTADKAMSKPSVSDEIERLGSQLLKEKEKEREKTEIELPEHGVEDDFISWFSNNMNSSMLSGFITAVGNLV